MTENLHQLLEVSQARWQSLDNSISELIDRYTKLAGVPRVQTLEGMARGLQRFAKNQFFFFQDGFGSKVDTYHPSVHQNLALELPPNTGEYPTPYVFRVTLNQVGHDLDLIQQAAEQRISGLGGNILDNADKLAQRALQPAMLLLPKETTVVSYFEKLPAIRVLPYAPVALVAVPYQARTIGRDFLAVPHEIGHYVYRHGKVAGRSIAATLEEQEISAFSSISTAEAKFREAVVHRWTEEIFADVYGGLVAGPVIALDFQDLELESSQEEFTTDDGDHPTPFMRPYIYTTVLKKMYQMDAWAAALENRWNDKLAQRNIDRNSATFEPKPFSHTDRAKYQTQLDTAQLPQSISLAEAQVIIDRLINIIFELLSDLQFESWSGTIEAKAQYFDQADVNVLYSDFENIYLKELTAGRSPEELSSQGCSMWEHWVAEVGGFERDETGQPLFPVPVPAGSLSDNPAGTWIHVLDAAGWATEGPNGRGG